jgi:hypothetical protein
MGKEPGVAWPVMEYSVAVRDEDVRLSATRMKCPKFTALRTIISRNGKTSASSIRLEPRTELRADPIIFSQSI